MGDRETPDDDQQGTRPHAVGWNALSYMLSGLLLGVGVGWLLSRWLGTDLMMLVGLLGGISLSMYVIWVRYVRQQ